MPRQYCGGDCQDLPDAESWLDTPGERADPLECPCCEGEGDLDSGEYYPMHAAFLCQNRECRVIVYCVRRVTAADRRADAGDAEYHRSVAQ